MSYEDISRLMADQEFLSRLSAGVVSESKGKNDFVSTQALRSPQTGGTMFAPFVSTEPGFSDAYASAGQASITDGQMLSAIQANWNAVVTTYT
jgi:hypothetical protein